jgi:hypothetical protein
MRFPMGQRGCRLMNATSSAGMHGGAGSVRMSRTDANALLAMVATFRNSPAGHSQRPRESLRRNLVRSLCPAFAALRRSLRRRLRIRGNQVARERPLTFDQHGVTKERCDHERRTSEICEVFHRSILGQGHAFVPNVAGGFARSRRKISDLNHSPTSGE